MANTTKIEDTQERKKVKRAARKKAAPKAKRTEPRGSKKKKIKKLSARPEQAVEEVSCLRMQGR